MDDNIEKLRIINIDSTIHYQFKTIDNKLIFIEYGAGDPNKIDYDWNSVIDFKILKVEL